MTSNIFVVFPSVHVGMMNSNPLEHEATVCYPCVPSVYTNDDRCDCIYVLNLYKCSNLNDDHIPNRQICFPSDGLCMNKFPSNLDDSIDVATQSCYDRTSRNIPVRRQIYRRRTLCRAHVDFLKRTHTLNTYV